MCNFLLGKPGDFFSGFFCGEKTLRGCTVSLCKIILCFFSMENIGENEKIQWKYHFVHFVSKVDYHGQYSRWKYPIWNHSPPWCCFLQTFFHLTSWREGPLKSDLFDFLEGGMGSIYIYLPTCTMHG